MLPDYRDDPNLPVLAGEIESGRCAVFLGAGVSVAAGLPSWFELVSTMRRRAGVSRDYGLLRTADICRQILGGERFTEIVAQEIGTQRTPGPIHQLLAKLPINLYITTNFDQLLERALEAQRDTDCRVLALQEPESWRAIPDLPTEPWVMKLHGCIGVSRSNLILTEEDMLGFAMRYEHVQRGLADLLARHPVLFVGFSLTDWDVLSALAKLKIDLGRVMPNRYFVGFDLEVAERRFLEQRYDIRVFNLGHLDPGARTRAVEEFLEQVVEHFQIPVWIRNLAAELGGYIDGKPGILDEPILSVFPEYNVTAASRFFLKVEQQFGISLPTEQIWANGTTIREFLSLIRKSRASPS